MSHTEALLVFGIDEQSELVEALFQLGFLPLIRSEMLNALKMIRHYRFAAVLVDRGDLEADALEFILNVRDIDAQIPIIVVGELANPAEKQAVSEQENTFQLSEAAQVKLENQLADVLNTS